MRRSAGDSGARRFRAQGGWSVVELITVLVIVLVVVAGMAAALTGTGLRIWGLSDAQLTSASNAQRALDRMSADLRRAQRASVRCPAATALEFSYVGSPAVMTYLRNAQSELVLSDGVTPRVQARNITSFRVECVDAEGAEAERVRVILTARATGLGGVSALQALMAEIRVQNP